MPGPSPCSKKKRPQIRSVYFNRIIDFESFDKQSSDEYCRNHIISSRYTWWNFLPINLYEQMHQLSNVIYVCLSLLYLFASGTNSFLTAVGPLSGAMSIALIKDGVYDFYRHRQDKKINGQLFKVLSLNKNPNYYHWSEIKSSELRVGDVLVCEKKDELPCDLLLLGSSDAFRGVQLTTANLDGETNIKTHYVITGTNEQYVDLFLRQVTSSELSDDTLRTLLGHVEYESPNPDLRRIQGKVLNVQTNEWDFLRFENVALRGCKLKNTDFIIGMAVYTGRDTKLSMNSKSAKRKYTSREHSMNVVLGIFALVALISCISFAIIQYFWDTKISPNEFWYLLKTNTSPFSFVQRVFTFSFIVSYLLPISLIMTVELQELILAYFISNDIKLYDSNQDVAGAANTYYTADELGQVEYLFSDKTGTLTANDMTLRACAVLSTANVYLMDDQDLFLMNSDQTNTPLNTKQSMPDWTNLTQDEAIMEKISGEMREDLEQFLEIMAICHTVEVQCRNPETGADTDPASNYQATSPDEIALVEGAARLGVILESAQIDVSDTSKRRLVVSRKGGNQTSETDSEYVVDAILEFDSNRKRMTVLVRYPDGTFHVHSKGAETRMLEPDACSGSDSRIQTLALKRANEFALGGLRTLVFASRQLDAEQYQNILDEYRRCQARIDPDKNQALEANMNVIESGLELKGVTGVEDKLQEGVKECLESLRDAGIQVWVLTGDKEETAVTVSHAAGHFPEAMSLLRLTGCKDFPSAASRTFEILDGMRARKEQQSVSLPNRKTGNRNPLPNTGPEEFNEVNETTDRDRTGTAISDENVEPSRQARTDPGKMKQKISMAHVYCKSRIRRKKRQAYRKPGGAEEPVGLIIDGESIIHLLHPSLRIPFLNLCMNVTTVLCCRMSPLQKASIVELVQLGLSEQGRPPITAAVGDGGNDVAMILQASVGIGIHGKEGKEAVRAADYALPQFCSLQRLLLVHGHWAYYRVTMTMNLFYYKSVIFVTTQLLLASYTGFSANSWFPDILFVIYNLTLTSILVLLFGIFEQHLLDRTLLNYPRLFQLINRNANLQWWYILLFVLDGIWAGTVIFYSVYLVLAGGDTFAPAAYHSDNPFGSNVFDFTLCGCACAVYIAICVNIRVLLQTRNLNLFYVGGALFVIGFNLILLMVLQITVAPTDLNYYSYNRLTQSPFYWLLLPLTVLAAILPALLWRITSDYWWIGQIEKTERHIQESRSQVRRPTLQTWLSDRRSSRPVI